MRRWTLGSLCLALVGLLGTPVFATTKNRGSDEPPAPATLLAPADAPRELIFEPNVGQTAEEVRFLTRGPGYTLFLTASEMVLALDPTTQDSQPTSERAVRVRFDGAEPPSSARGRDPMPSFSSYFVGNDPSRWRTRVPHFAKVVFENVYPGIDVVYRSHGGQVEYDFVVAPGSEPGAVRLAIEGADAVRLDEKGDLVVALGDEEMRMLPPVVYQEAAGGRREIDSTYVLEPSGRIGFQIAEYDVTLPLVVDPVLSYSTYLGGTSFDYGGGIGVDAAGNVYVAGHTQSLDFPALSALQPAFAGGKADAFVAKLDPSGALVWATYLGGSKEDFGNHHGDLAVDAAGNVYVTGPTFSDDFPLVNPAHAAHAGAWDTFITKIDATGTALAYSTYIGSSGFDASHGIAVDGAGNAYVAGAASSNLDDFPTTPGAFQESFASNPGSDAFVVKLDATGAIAWATLLGGFGGDTGAGITVDGSGHPYVVGWAEDGFPTTPGAFQASYNARNDGFVTKLAPDGGSLVYSTYLGGSANGVDQARAVAVDAGGRAHVVGNTEGDFPTTPGAFEEDKSGVSFDAFAVKLAPDGSFLEYGTYLSGLDTFDAATDVELDGSGGVFVSGSTAASDFPVLDEIQSFGGGRDAFVTQLDPTGSSLVFSTHYGGSGDEQAGFSARAVRIALAPGGDLWLNGSTTSTDLPLVDPVQSARLGDVDSFVARISFDGEGPVTTDVIPSPSPASVNDVVLVTATIDDTDTGGSDIASADFEVRDGAVVRLAATGDNASCFDPALPCPGDIVFDDVVEYVEVTVDAADLGAGVYDACVSGTDANGNVGAAACAFLVVYDPDGGFVTGGGWIDSPAGACSLTELCETASGKANFGFVSKYQVGANVPTGNTAFRFNAGDLKFKSTEYEWMVIAGPQAQYKGSGTINNSGDYGFLLTARDDDTMGGPPEDTFRIKIWDKAAGDVVVYDNGSNQPIAGGSIVFHQ
ncbi:MAG: SBBP repeat-containing protein [Thermoanaerobaculia bacterium]|nr:SBBP repeat-containing protein [Thermoanaerobaculia bacterium]